MTQIDKTEALLPCPFCGGVPEIKERGESIALFVCSRAPCKGSSTFMGFVRDDREKAIAAWNRRAALPARGVGVPERVQHKKRGSTYRVVGRGKVQTDTPLTEYAEVVVYQCEAGGTVWVRPVSEFEDGRFAALEPALAPTDAAQAREAALREAADSLLEASVWCDSQERTSPEWHNGVADARKHHIARILALSPALAPTDAAHVNETPKSEHDAGNVLTPAQAREAVLPDDFDRLVADGIAEAMKAMRKFPQPNYVISKIAEEAGEVVKAAIHAAEGRETAENLRGEMKQLIAMLYRLWIEGDQVHGLGSVSAALIGEART